MASVSAMTASAVHGVRQRQRASVPAALITTITHTLEVSKVVKSIPAPEPVKMPAPHVAERRHPFPLAYTAHCVQNAWALRNRWAHEAHDVMTQLRHMAVETIHETI